MKYNKRFVLIGAFAFILLAGCEKPRVDEIQFKENLALKLSDDKKTAKVLEITPFLWDEMCMLERADDSIKPDSVAEFIKYKKFKKSAQYSDFSLKRFLIGEDYQTAFVFVKEGAVVNVIRLNGGITLGGKHFWIHQGRGAGCVSATEASFSIVRRNLITFVEFSRSN